MRSVEDVAIRIRKQADENAAGQVALERLVLEGRESGMSLRAIAAEARMTPEGVRKMLKRLDEQSEAVPEVAKA